MPCGQSRGGSGIRRDTQPCTSTTHRWLRASHKILSLYLPPSLLSLETPPSAPYLRFTHLKQWGTFSPTPTQTMLFQSSSSLKRQTSTSASAVGLKQTISQNMRLSKSKVTSFLKGNHMNYSIVHRNHFYNTLPHVFFPSLSRSVDGIAYWCRIFIWGCATTVTGDL